MTTQEVRVGIASPRAIDWTIAASDELPNLTTVTAAVVTALSPKGEASTWAASIVSATAASMRIRHVFAANGADVHLRGTWKTYATLTAAGLTYRTSVDMFNAVGEWE